MKHLMLAIKRNPGIMYLPALIFLTAAPVNCPVQTNKPIVDIRFEADYHGSAGNE